jgi:DNA-binding transcriptional ArsR family regulator
VRGGGSIASVLPVLALHTWPDKTHGADPLAAGWWTAWQPLSYRRIARLAGVTPETVGQALKRLVALGLAERRLDAPPDHFGGPRRNSYRLRTDLYASGKEKFAVFGGGMLYGGHWAFLPTPAARQLYIALACLQPVLNEKAYLGKRDLEPGSLMAEEILAEVRQHRPLSLEMLARASGMSRPAVAEALEVLKQPQHEGKGYIKAVPAERDGMFSYALEPVDWLWTTDFLNEPADRWRAVRLEQWPHLARRAPAKRPQKRRRTA